jgi:hypothetical protein
MPRSGSDRRADIGGRHLFFGSCAPILFLVFISTTAFGQDKEIQAYRTFGGMRFEMDTLTLTHRQVSELLSINTTALTEFQKARRNNVISGVLGFGGAMLLAIPVFSALLGGDPEWGLAAAGAGMLIVSIPISRAYQRRSESAITMYNSGLKQSRLYFTGTGFAVRF